MAKVRKTIACPEPPARCEIFASLDNSYNFLTMNLTADPQNTEFADKCDQDPCVKWPSFNGNFAIVLSPSRALSKDIGNDLLKQNVIESINFQPLPGDELKLSNESWNDEDDVVMWLMRMAFPKNET